MNGACAHYVMVSKLQWKPFWLASQRDPHNAHLQVVIPDNDWSFSRIATGRFLG